MHSEAVQVCIENDDAAMAFKMVDKQQGEGTKDIKRSLLIEIAKFLLKKGKS